MATTLDLPERKLDHVQYDYFKAEVKSHFHALMTYYYLRNYPGVEFCKAHLLGVLKQMEYYESLLIDSGQEFKSLRTGVCSSLARYR